MVGGGGGGRNLCGHYDKRLRTPDFTVIKGGGRDPPLLLQYRKEQKQPHQCHKK